MYRRLTLASNAVAILAMILLCDPVRAVPSVYEGFDYPNDVSPLDGQEGGYGWTSSWVETGDEGVQFTLSQDDTSINHPGLPFAPVGDRTVYTPPLAGANVNFATRDLGPAAQYDLATDTTFYASFLMSKSGSAESSGDNMEFDFVSNGGNVMRFGSTSPDAFFLGVSGANSDQGESVVFDENYFVVLKAEATAEGLDTFTASMFDTSETVPVSEPVSWDLTYELDSDALINQARFWVGINASGTFDELRMGLTYDDVTSFDPNFLRGDFDNNTMIDVGDYQTLSSNLFTGTTYAQGDIDGSGLVDLTDFAIFRNIYDALPPAALATSAVPEPTAAALLTVATCCLLGWRRTRWSGLETKA